MEIEYRGNTLKGNILRRINNLKNFFCTGKFLMRGEILCRGTLIGQYTENENNLIETFTRERKID